MASKSCQEFLTVKFPAIFKLFRHRVNASSNSATVTFFTVFKMCRHCVNAVLNTPYSISTKGHSLITCFKQLTIFVLLVNGGYGAWTSYGPCSKTCGAGTQTRSRPCNNPAPLNGGKNCSSLGPAKESKPCNIEMCYGNYCHHHADLKIFI